MTSPSPFLLLTLARIREFYREPIAVFWVYGFPLILALILGIAFRNRPVEKINVDLASDTADSVWVRDLEQTLAADSRLVVTVHPETEARNRLRTTKTALVIAPSNQPPGREFLVDPNRPDSTLARSAVESAILKKLNPSLSVARQTELEETGGRYIDFLIPGLIGVNLMGGGLWGVGFVIVDMRVKKLMKRLMATPMKRSDFLMSLMASRILFTLAEIVFLLTFAVLAFGIRVHGSWLALAAVILMGALCFAGFGLLVACRAKTIETASGLMNLVMLPMYLFSGVFFASSNFPDFMQPVIQLLPLTALNNALRAVINDGAGLMAVGPDCAIMAVWTVICYAVGYKLFRWL